MSSRTAASPLVFFTSVPGTQWLLHKHLLTEWMCTPKINGLCRTVINRLDRTSLNSITHPPNPQIQFQYSSKNCVISKVSGRWRYIPIYIKNPLYPSIFPIRQVPWTFLFIPSSNSHPNWLPSSFSLFIHPQIYHLMNQWVLVFSQVSGIITSSFRTFVSPCKETGTH